MKGCTQELETQQNIAGWLLCGIYCTGDRAHVLKQLYCLGSQYVISSSISVRDPLSPCAFEEQCSSTGEKVSGHISQNKQSQSQVQDKCSCPRSVEPPICQWVLCGLYFQFCNEWKNLLLPGLGFFFFFLNFICSAMFFLFELSFIYE